MVCQDRLPALRLTLFHIISLVLITQAELQMRVCIVSQLSYVLLTRQQPSATCKSGSFGSRQVYGICPLSERIHRVATNWPTGGPLEGIARYENGESDESSHECGWKCCWSTGATQLGIKFENCILKTKTRLSQIQRAVICPPNEF